MPPDAQPLRDLLDIEPGDVRPDETLFESATRKAIDEVYRERDEGGTMHDAGEAAARIALIQLNTERGKALIGKAIHGYACGCDQSWPTNANYEAMATAVVEALLNG